ncbi:NAD(P)H-dependent flavin oxidoreductase [Eilatimonas milleporae]|uniref:Nitronate monooxygenase n=1 Tax=Eilatimonas milleporae TaxID=911205 RepID=A0A3M0CQD8_9PROT|nr:nitronate monooxygenase [Eilatimonas milleporae]RMB11774.1 nitronate monooxygenase [Eilatimonas milleporae]
MAIPAGLRTGLKLPVIAAPMFLISEPGLVTACCRAGVIGTFPTLNARTTGILDEWMTEISQFCTSGDAPWGVNLIVHKSNARLDDDLALVLKHKPPLVITSVGHPGNIAEKVHAYGGVVFHDVIHMRHAAKAAEAGVDGIIAVCAGAGGHAGTLNPFAFIPQLKQTFDKTIILAGTISDGRSVRAAEVLGADMAYLGTRFIASREARVADGYKRMIEDDSSSDIVYTNKISGIWGNFLNRSLHDAGVDPETGKVTPPEGGAKTPWKEIWSAGQGIGTIDDSPPVADIIDRLKRDYSAARDETVSF